MTPRDTPRDIACIELVELLTDYLEGALRPDEVAAVEAHLDLDRGVASGVQDFPGYDDVDGRHEHLLHGM